MAVRHVIRVNLEFSDKGQKPGASYDIDFGALQEQFIAELAKLGDQVTIRGLNAEIHVDVDEKKPAVSKTELKKRITALTEARARKTLTISNVKVNSMVSTLL